MPRRLILSGLSIASERLPERVRRAIERQEEDSEKLIGWVQLAIVLVFVILYTVSPKTFDQRAVSFEPVPLALGGYALFTVIRLGLAYGKRLPGWFLYLSMVIDMALLMGLIWSFHIQYHQPASFYLKAPTLLYVFIFIALRALRFEPRFVLTAGLLAAVGWGGMMSYAMTIDPLDRMLTRNYVEYLTSNKILIGAEIDKMLTILMVTVILALALGRARHLLVTAVAEGAKARDLARFFAPEVASRITDAEQQILAGQGEARDAAILMVDLRGFTRLAAGMAPGAVIGLLAEYQTRVVPVIRRHGGVIDKFMGDGIMATFGALAPSATFAADALRAVEDLLAEAARWNAERQAAGAPPLVVNAGLASGRVVVGAVGDADRLEYTVIGDAVNLAAKLEKHNKEEGSLAVVTAGMLELAVVQGHEAAGPFHPKPECMVAGVCTPLSLYMLMPATSSIAPLITPSAATLPLTGPLTGMDLPHPAGHPPGS
jgi:adenylate cyclase